MVVVLVFSSLKKGLCLGKNSLIVSIYRFYFSLKILLQEYLGNKSKKYFSIKPFFGVLQIKCLLKCPSFKLLLPKNFLIACLFYQNLSGRQMVWCLFYLMPTFLRSLYISFYFTLFIFTPNVLIGVLLHHAILYN